MSLFECFDRGLFYHYKRCSKERRDLISLAAAYRESAQENIFNLNLMKNMYEKSQRELLEQKSIVDYTLLEKEKLQAEYSEKQDVSINVDLKNKTVIDSLKARIVRLKSTNKKLIKKVKNGRCNDAADGKRVKSSSKESQ